jgi:hypothetical protein
MTLTKEQKREIARRIENWGRWYYGKVNVLNVGSKIAAFPAYRLANDDSPRDEVRRIPMLMGEAEDTWRILRKMHPVLKKALEVHVLSRGTPKSLARRCRCKSVRTYYRRVEHAEVVFNRLCFPLQPEDSTKEMRAAA